MREKILKLMEHVAESEHALRHPEAFEALVHTLGFDLVRAPHKLIVLDPVAEAAKAEAAKVEAEKAAAEAAKAAEAPAAPKE